MADSDPQAPIQEPQGAESEHAAEGSSAAPAEESASEEEVQLPPPEQEPASPPITASIFRPLDVPLAALVVALGFLLAAFAIGNNDFWLHLATGRWLSENLLHLYESDPFTYLSDSATWVNPSWLADLAVFHLHELFGGSGLVVAKGVLIGLLALVMLATRERDGSLWISVVAVTLALVAMSLRLLFQPVLFSLLFLALTVFVLNRRPDDEGAETRTLWLLPPLFLLWANLDVWFILGPITLLLWLVGEALQYVLPASTEGNGKPPTGRLKTLCVVLLLGIAACFINPYFHRVWQLPTELAYLLESAGVSLPFGLTAGGKTVVALADFDPSIAGPYTQSVFSPRYWDSLRQMANLPGVCHLVLLIGGFLSFLAILIAGQPDSSRPVWPRFAVWLAFGALSLTMLRLFPFAAVVGGVILALNWQDAHARIRGQVSLPPRLSLAWGAGGRLVTLAALGGLLFLVWPGWLRSPYGEPHSIFRVDFRVAPDPAFEKAAQYLNQWHQGGKANRVFNVEPDIACYLAWYAPGIRYAFDYRYSICSARASELAKARRSLMQVEKPRTHREEKRLRDMLAARQQVLNREKVDYVVFSWKRLPQQYGPMLAYLLRRSDEWGLACGSGFGSGLLPVAVFRWQGNPDKPVDRRTPAGLDFASLAFAKKADREPVSVETIRFPAPPDFWTKYLGGVPPGSLHVAQSEFYSFVHNQLADHRTQIHFMAHMKPFMSLDGIASAAANAAVTPAAGLGTGSRWLTHCLALVVYRSGQQLDPDLTFPLLAMREARRAIRENPGDPISHLSLADANTALWIVEQSAVDPDPHNRKLADAFQRGRIGVLDYWEQSHSPIGFSQRYEWRRLITAASYHNALVADPENHRVHWRMCNLLQSHHFMRLRALGVRTGRMEGKTIHLDVALHHVAKAREGLEKIRRPTKEEAERLEKLSKFQEALAKEVAARKRFYRLRIKADPSPVNRVLQLLFAPYEMNVQGKKIISPLGLSGEALQVIEETNRKKLSRQQQAELLECHLNILASLGRLEEMFRVFQEGKKDGLVPPALHVEMMAVVDLVGGQLPQFDAMIREIEADGLGELTRQAIPAFVAYRLMSKAHGLELREIMTPYLAQQRGLAVRQPLSAFQAGFAIEHMTRKIAEYRCLRGLILLEDGKVAEAEQCFREALEIGGRFFDLTDLHLAHLYLEHIASVNRTQP